MRYKFLVLDGPSGLGKTQYAMSLCPGRSLEVNMACAPEPDLREYRARDHDLILFDECGPQAAVRQKKLFQAPAAEVLLGASATNCHSYKVWVSGKRLVVSTNVWRAQVQQMPAVDAAWLDANSVVVDITTPLWIH
jgi:hypothetical protein